MRDAPTETRIFPLGELGPLEASIERICVCNFVLSRLGPTGASIENGIVFIFILIGKVFVGTAGQFFTS